MALLSLMRSVATPLGFSLEDQPWVSSTIWRTVTDSTNRIVLFDSAMSPATFWVKLDDLDLKPGAPVKKLELTGGKTTTATPPTSLSMPSVSTSRRSTPSSRSRRSEPEEKRTQIKPQFRYPRRPIIVRAGTDSYLSEAGR